MTDAPTLIAGDWGTTHLRVFLCSALGVLGRRSGPGVGQLQSSPEEALFELIGPWLAQYGPLPIWLAGMVGSRNGWREAPYLPCPANARSLARSLLRFVARDQQIAIVPGVSCRNPRGAPDVMRGEETQIIGATAIDPEPAPGRRVMALPGTHTKWALVTDGCLESFQTSLSGELYALLRERSTLVMAATGAATDAAECDAAFEQGLGRARELSDAPLTHLLFETRSRQLMGEMGREQALSFLSGLIIGQDVLGALPLFDRALQSSGAVELIGSRELTSLYAKALALCGIRARQHDAGGLTLAGLRGLAQSNA